MKLLPQTQAPSLKVELLSRQPWSLHARSASKFVLLIVYRGYHCPVCKNYLKEAQRLQPEFSELGVELTALSADTRERAERSRDEWAVQELTIGYGMTQGQMSDWGLYVSRGIKDAEPDLFAEPGLFLVKTDGTLFYAAYNSMPFGRPVLEDMLKAIKFIQKNDYPARGEATLSKIGSR